VSYETIKADRERVRELLQERVIGNAQEHLMSLQVARENVERDILATESGPARAALYAILVRLTEDMARLDGTWAGQGEMAPPVDNEFAKGPTPQELLQAGKITREDYRSALVVIAVRTGGKMPLPRSKQVIEGKARLLPAPKVVPDRPVDVPLGHRDNGSHAFDASKDM
jgi:hypothetical protein